MALEGQIGLAHPSGTLMRVLVLNGGTSTVKAALVETEGSSVTVCARQRVEGRAGRSSGDLFAEALDEIAADAARVDAVGHRVVHGGTRFGTPVLIDSEVEAGIESLVPLAPLHNPVALAGIRVARARIPGRPMVAVFDTAFHQDRAAVARRYGLPDDLTATLGLWRYGFHGIAHVSLIEGVAALEGTMSSVVTAVTLQLGQGCSACAVLRGASVETSMGFTPLEGLVMGTRSGDVDPGLVLYLLRRGKSAAEVEEILERQSGLLGVGGSADMRELAQAEAQGDSRAALAIALFVRRIVTTVGGYLTLLRGEGALVFGGGIGENASSIRERVAADLRVWDVTLDPARNTATGARRISADGTRPVYVIPTDEETAIARATRTLLEANQ